MTVTSVRRHESTCRFNAMPNPDLRSSSLSFSTLRLLVTTALALASASAGAQARAGNLSATERAIAASVDAHNSEALPLLERIVNINSGTLNLAGVRQVGDVLRAPLDALGFTTRWIDGAPFHRAGHLIAEHPGPGQKI